MIVCKKGFIVLFVGVEHVVHGLSLLVRVVPRHGSSRWRSLVHRSLKFSRGLSESQFISIIMARNKYVSYCTDAIIPELPIYETDLYDNIAPSILTKML